MRKILALACLLPLVTVSAQAGGLSFYAGGGYLSTNADMTLLDNVDFTVSPPVLTAKEEAPAGLMFGGGAELGLLPKINVGLSVSYWKGTIENSKDITLPTGLPWPAGTYPLVSKIETTIIPVLATARISLPMGGLLSGYAKAGVGLASVKLSTTNTIGGADIGFGGEGSETGYAALVGAGLETGFTPIISAFAEGGYLLTGVEVGSTMTGKTTALGGLQVGGGLRISMP